MFSVPNSLVEKPADEYYNDTWNKDVDVKIIKKPTGPPPSLNFLNSLVSGATNIFLAFGTIGANIASSITSGIKGVWKSNKNS